MSANPTSPVTHFHSSLAPAFRRVHQGIVPPHLLGEIARRGTADERDWAQRTLARDAEMRTARALLSTRPGGAAADALAGAVPGRRSGVASGLDATRPHAVIDPPAGTPRRDIHDARHGQRLPGPEVRREGQPPVPDESVDEAYDALGSIHRFWWEVFGRDSIDGAGMMLVASVHFGRQHRNAFWNGAEMVFGDGDGVLFQGFTRSLDVVGHELAHGITQHEAGLAYFGQSGALNESLSDVFGTLARQWALQQTAEQADWIIGAGVFGPTVAGAGLRSMKAPGTAYDDPRLGRDPQPAHMRGFIRTADDNGGVHINSGIPNHAFYRLAVQLGGHAWARAGQIWHAALCHPALAPDADFSCFAAITRECAVALHGAASVEAEAVADAWSAVGVRPRASRPLSAGLSPRPALPSVPGNASVRPRSPGRGRSAP